eukprot:PhM_4_TR18414/c0_g1_i1/m.24671
MPIRMNQYCSALVVAIAVLTSYGLLLGLVAAHDHHKTDKVNKFFSRDTSARVVSFRVRRADECAPDIVDMGFVDTAPTTAIFPLQQSALTAEVFASLPTPNYHHILHDVQLTKKFVLTFEARGRHWAYVISDPRYHSHHTDLVESGDASHVMYLPGDANELKVHCHNTSVPVRPHVLSRHNRRFTAQGSSEFVQGRIQTVGPSNTQFNIVFLSAGYQKADQNKFTKDAEDVFKLLREPYFNDVEHNHIKDTVPWTRYIPFFNVFTVFEPSVDSGASVIDGPTVNNNLKCTYPDNAKGTGLRCDMQLSVALAQASPAHASSNKARTAIVVLVNHDRYGGTGLYLPDTRLAVFSNSLLHDGLSTGKANMASLVSHELGHAITNLMDEYNIGSMQSTKVAKPNCAFTNDVSQVPWAHWLDSAYKTRVTESLALVRKTTPTYGVATKPVPICGWSNYFKPADNCMMQKLETYYMCPVCREAATINLLESGIAYTWPQCPLKDHLVMVPTRPNIDYYMFVNQALDTTNDFAVEWSAPSTVSLRDCSAIGVSSPTCRNLIVPPGGFVFTGRIDITVTIYHNTTWVVKDRSVGDAKWKQTTSFSYFVYATAEPPTKAGYNATLTMGNCKGAGLASSSLTRDFKYDYFCSTASGAVCELNFASPEYSKPNTDVDLKKANESLYYIVVIGAFVCVLLWVFAVLKYNGQAHARPIFRTQYSGPIRIMAGIMQLFAVVNMFLSGTMIVIGLYAYGNMGPFGQILLFAGLALAFALYILAFVGYWAVANRGRTLLLVNGFLLLVSFALTVGFCIALIQMHNNIANEGTLWHKWLHQLWSHYVKNDPPMACQAELYLECTGWTFTCDSPRAITEDCPECAEAVGKPWSTCQKRLTDYIMSEYSILYRATLAVCVAGFFALVFNMILYFYVRRMKKNIYDMHMRRLARLSADKKTSPSAGGGSAQPPTLKPNHSFRMPSKVASQGSETRALMILRSLGKQDLLKLAEEFDRIDHDGNGSLSRSELQLFFRSALCYNPSKAEIDRIFDLADTDKSGTISMCEFMALFGVKLPPKAARPPPLTTTESLMSIVSFRKHKPSSPSNSEVALKDSESVSIPEESDMEREHRRAAERALAEALAQDGWDAEMVETVSELDVPASPMAARHQAESPKNMFSSHTASMQI